MIEIKINMANWKSYLLGFTSCLLLIIGFSFMFFGLYRHENIPLPLIEYTRVVAGTGSMLPSVSPDTKLDTIKFNGKIKCGHTYIYNVNETSSVVHRLVYEDNKGILYFKGDNNKYWDDPINISQVIEEVVGVRWD